MIEIKDLAFSYGKTPVLKSITTTLEEGRIYGLLRENGVGKTTLLTLLCGLKKVCSGSITTDGENPFDRTPTLLQNQFYLPDEVLPVAIRRSASQRKEEPSGRTTTIPSSLRL